MTVKCGGESEIDIELKKVGSLALSSLKALRTNATGLCFTSENGTRRSVRVVEQMFSTSRKVGRNTLGCMKLWYQNQMSTDLLLLPSFCKKVENVNQSLKNPNP